MRRSAVHHLPGCTSLREILEFGIEGDAPDNGAGAESDDVGAFLCQSARVSAAPAASSTGDQGNRAPLRVSSAWRVEAPERGTGGGAA